VGGTDDGTRAWRGNRRRRRRRRWRWSWKKRKERKIGKSGLMTKQQVQNACAFLVSCMTSASYPLPPRFHPLPPSSVSSLFPPSGCGDSLLDSLCHSSCDHEQQAATRLAPPSYSAAASPGLFPVVLIASAADVDAADDDDDDDDDEEKMGGHEPQLGSGWTTLH